MPVISQVSPDDMAGYRATARHRWEAEQQELAQRRKRARQVAQRAATFLKEQFGATRVVVFGSLVHGYWFSRTSDIDLAAWGLQPDDYFVAVARLQDLSPEFSVDLVTAERCKPALHEAILQGEAL